MNFSDKWRLWIRNCIRTTKVSFLVNVSSSSKISLSRGLRQRDPLSPLLFIITTEGLSCLLKNAMHSGLFIGLSVDPTDPSLIFSNLQFADDTLIFLEPNMEMTMSIKRLLWIFSTASGLSINFSKSSLMGFNLIDEWLSQCSRIIRCKYQSLVSLYLGLPLGSNPRRIST